VQGSGGSIESLSRSIASARVDLNPHQVEAALFAMRSPFSRGVILADEVGLGKTIEAGIVIAQKWAERKRRLLLILPATLRKQWQQELLDKFAVPSIILESKSFNDMRRAGHRSPFELRDRVIICSYHFAANKADELADLNWDLVVIDEAHRLRNVYRTSSRIARAIARSVRTSPKLLLTATPLQNSLMELFGLVSIVDEHTFGDEESFREQFTRLGSAQTESTRNAALKDRMRPVLTRTLRKQVLEYIRFTQRVPLTQDFLPTPSEVELYDSVSAYLQRDVLLALPASQRGLITLILRKLLASSSFAIAGTLRRLTQRLERMERSTALVDDEDFEGVGELEDEWDDSVTEAKPATKAPDAQQLRAEIEELRRYAELGESIHQNSKGDALLAALQTALEQAQSLGAARKAVIFTESRRTQQYLHDLLAANGYANQIVLINGTNADPESRRTYERWVERHRGSQIASGSRTADTKAALVEEFRDRASILIATESAAEGVNLQFCSLVVNYDLPWNPQRIEQRIGRCHRYGQKHDVVVVNFLNRSNAADQRVFQLLSEKFRLFDGVFGASDEVLGVVESGVDLEKRIAQVYQDARTEKEIQLAFDSLQAELDQQIQNRLAETRQSVLEHLDAEVQHRLEVFRDRALTSLSERQRWLMDLTKHELNGAANFDSDQPCFRYAGGLAPEGIYHFDWRVAEANDYTFFSLEHPLAQQLVQQARLRSLPAASLRLDYRALGAPVSALEPFLGTSGWFELARLGVSSVEDEEYLIVSGAADDGRELDEDQCRKLLMFPAVVEHELVQPSGPAWDTLALVRQRHVQQRRQELSERNARYLDEETEKLERWADDRKHSLEQELRELDRQIREARKASKLALTLAEKLESQKEQRTLEATRSRKRRELYEAQDSIERRRDELIDDIEKQLAQRTSVDAIFAFKWTLVS
jgi:adenine-specific DNA-methyltransferase